MIMKIYHPSHSSTRRMRGNALHAGREGDAVSARAYTILARLWKESQEGSRRHPIYRGTVSNLSGSQPGSFSSVEELGDILVDKADMVTPRKASTKALSATDRKRMSNAYARPRKELVQDPHCR